jgi:hypothetical protein
MTGGCQICDKNMNTLESNSESKNHGLLVIHRVNQITDATLITLNRGGGA